MRTRRSLRAFDSYPTRRIHYISSLRHGHTLQSCYLSARSAQPLRQPGAPRNRAGVCLSKRAHFCSPCDVTRLRSRLVGSEIVIFLDFLWGGGIDFSFFIFNGNPGYFHDVARCARAGARRLFRHATLFERSCVNGGPRRGLAVGVQRVGTLFFRSRNPGDTLACFDVLVQCSVTLLFVRYHSTS